MFPSIESIEEFKVSSASNSAEFAAEGDPRCHDLMANRQQQLGFSGTGMVHGQTQRPER